MRQRRWTWATIGLGATVFVHLLSAPLHAQEDEWFAEDKALHFAVSAGLAAGGYVVATTVFECRRGRIATGAATALAAGIGKELHDRSRDGGVASWKDLAWDVLGTVAGLLVAVRVDGPDRCAAPPGASAASRPHPLGTMAGSGLFRRDTFGSNGVKLSRGSEQPRGAPRGPVQRRWFFDPEAGVTAPGLPSLHAWERPAGVRP